MRHSNSFLSSVVDNRFIRQCLSRPGLLAGIWLTFVLVVVSCAFTIVIVFSEPGTKSYEYIRAITAIVTASASLVTVLQVLIAMNVFLHTQNWNKLQATFTFFRNEDYLHRVEEASEALAQFGVDFEVAHDPLPDGVIDKICAADARKHFRAIKGILNFHEEYCCAVTTRVLDYDIAFRIMAGIVTRHYTVLKPLIARVRAVRKEEDIWREFETIAKEWDKRLANRR